MACRASWCRRWGGPPTGWRACSTTAASAAPRFATSSQPFATRARQAASSRTGPPTALQGSSPSMKWVNPPVAYMLHAGLPLLLDAGVHIPGLHAGDERRVALEAYPGLLAREVLARRSYKSDDTAKQTPDRLIARKDLVNALELGSTRLGLRLKLSHAQRDALVDDASGDTLDAVLCLLQAAWGQQRHADGADALYGLPATLDPLEGWIVSA
ncbi:MAG: DUF429 domain-containing protein [Acidovorax sp.]|nr:DUF429 domain-containing protein [Acidovorax sp.]